VKNRFQNLPFKFNLQRYAAAAEAAADAIDGIHDATTDLLGGGPGAR
jgi:hypothetical protein